MKIKKRNERLVNMLNLEKEDRLTNDQTRYGNKTFPSMEKKG